MEKKLMKMKKLKYYKSRDFLLFSSYFTSPQNSFHSPPPIVTKYFSQTFH